MVRKIGLLIKNKRHRNGVLENLSHNNESGMRFTDLHPNQKGFFGIGIYEKRKKEDQKIPSPCGVQWVDIADD